MTSIVRHAYTSAFTCRHYGMIGNERPCAVCILVLSVAAAPEDPGGPGPGSVDIRLQLRGQWPSQDTSEDPQEQPCQSL